MFWVPRPVLYEPSGSIRPKFVKVSQPSVNCVPDMSKSQRCDWDRANVSRNRAEFVDSGLHLAKFGPYRADFGPHVVEHASTWADFAPSLIDVGPHLVEAKPNLANIGPMSTSMHTSGHIWSPAWPKAGSCEPAWLEFSHPKSTSGRDVQHAVMHPAARLWTWRVPRMSPRSAVTHSPTCRCAHRHPTKLCAPGPRSGKPVVKSGVQESTSGFQGISASSSREYFLRPRSGRGIRVRWKLDGTGCPRCASRPQPCASPTILRPENFKLGEGGNSCPPTNPIAHQANGAHLADGTTRRAHSSALRKVRHANITVHVGGHCPHCHKTPLLKLHL